VSLDALHSFLKDRLRFHDALLINCIRVDGQDVRAKILKVYTTRHEGPVKYSHGEIAFVGTPGSWGNPTLQNNDTALAFVGYLEKSKRYYQHHWLAHFLVTKVDGQEFALVTWNIDGKNWWPSELHDQCLTPDLERPWRAAIPFRLFEVHLEQVIHERLA